MKLQQGNYVLLDGTKEVEVIWQKSKKVCVLEVGYVCPTSIVSLNRLSGLPINEEKLLRMGFKRFPWGLVAEELLFQDDLKCNYLRLQVGNGFKTTIYEIHRLQNLVFELTDKWLTL